MVKDKWVENGRCPSTGLLTARLRFFQSCEEPTGLINQPLPRTPETSGGLEVQPGDLY